MKNISALSLYLFAPASIQFLSNYLHSGADAVIIDWENNGKRLRQFDRDTQINEHSRSDLEFARRITEKKIICRINNCASTLVEEIETAIAFGADEILLPMVRAVSDVENTLKIANGRLPVGILIETREAINNACELAALPLSHVYVGLNDLAIDLGYQSIFKPLLDGTLDKIREFFQMAFGFGGVTHPDYGHPIPCRLLIREMARLNCSFSFLRRSFYRDSNFIESKEIIVDAKTDFLDSLQRDTESIQRDQALLLSYIRRAIHEKL